MTKPPEMKLYHTGMIVDDLDVAMQTFGSALGLHWAPPRTATTPMRGPEGVKGREVRFTYGLEGPHHLELLEQVDASPYVALTGGRHVHHLGYYTRDLRAAAQWLDSQGFIMELSGVNEDGGVGRATFHRHPVLPSFWIELVSGEIADEIGEWMALAATEQGIYFESPFR